VHVPTEKVPDWFDAQVSVPDTFIQITAKLEEKRNDYNAYKSLPTRSVNLIWFSHPGDTPVDIRTRPFLVKWEGGTDLSSHGRTEVIRHGRVVHRWEYVCNGACSLMPEDETDLESGTAGPSENEAPSQHGQPVEIRRGDKCSTRVKLVVSRHVSLSS